MTWKYSHRFFQETMAVITIQIPTAGQERNGCTALLFSWGFVCFGMLSSVKPVLKCPDKRALSLQTVSTQLSRLFMRWSSVSSTKSPHTLVNPLLLRPWQLQSVRYVVKDGVKCRKLEITKSFFNPKFFKVNCLQFSNLLFSIKLLECRGMLRCIANVWWL